MTIPGRPPVFVQPAPFEAEVLGPTDPIEPSPAVLPLFRGGRITSVENRVEARVVANPTRPDQEPEIDTDYIRENLILEASSVTASFARNSIPTATVTLATGRRAPSDFDVSGSHPIVKKFIRRVPILIEVRLFGTEDGQKAWPDGFFTIFDGFTTSVGLKRAFEDASYQLQIVHWLAALLDSSVLSRRLHPSAPGPMFTSHRGDPGIVPLRLEPNQITDDLWGQATLPFLREIAEDDRANVEELRRLDESISRDEAPGNEAALAALDRFVVFDPFKGLSDSQKAEVNRIFNGEERFRESERERLVNERLQRFTALTTPLPVNEEELNQNAFIRSKAEIADNLFHDQIQATNNEENDLPAVPLTVSRDINSDIRFGAVGSHLKHIITRSVRMNDTFWGRILMFAQQFQVSIIPAVNQAAIAPVLPVGAAKFHRFIRAGEIFTVQGTGTTDRLPRGMALYASDGQGLIGINGAQGFSQAAVGSPEFLGIYDLKKSLDEEVKNSKNRIFQGDKKPQVDAIKANAQLAGKGLWLFRNAPMWLQAYISVGQDQFMKVTTRRNGAGAVQFSHAYGLEPPLVDNDGNEIRVPPPLRLSKEEVQRFLQIGDRYAKWAFLDEAFKNRVVMLSGRFRVDISPGSTVRFETMGANILNLPIAGSYTGVFQGLVDQVSLTIDAESAVAMTTFSISHVRNESEIATQSLSPPRHPVYNQDWLGGFLAPQREGILRSLADERRGTQEFITILRQIIPGAIVPRAPI